MPQTTGRLTAVVDRWVGSNLTADIAAGVSVLPVADVRDFDESGGRLSIEGDTYSFTATDDAASTITLSGVTSAAYQSGFRVLVKPATKEKVAIVDLTDGAPGVEARIRHTDYAMYPEGVRDGEAQEFVRLRSTRSGWVVSDALGAPKVIETTVLDGPPPDGWTGVEVDPPTAAPTVAAVPFAVAAIEVSISKVDHAVAYEVAASLTSPVPTDGSATIRRTASSSTVISDIAGVEVPMGATVYVAVRAVNDVGSGPWSSEASAVTRTGDQYITAAFIAALEIEATQIKSGTTTAEVGILGRLLVGDRAVWDGDTSIITIYARDLDSEGNLVPLIVLDPDGSTFRGRVVADDISVLNGLILIGTNSEISSGAGMWLGNGVADPTAVATLSAQAKSFRFDYPPAGYAIRGLSWDSVDGCWLRLLVPTSTSVQGGTLVEKIGTDGFVTSTITLANLSGIGEDDFNGICRVGSYYWTTWYDSYGSGAFGWAQFSTTGTNVAWQYGPANAVGRGTTGKWLGNPSGLTTLAAFVSTEFTPRLNVETTNGSSSDYLRGSDGGYGLDWDADAYGTSLSFIEVRTFDFGAQRLVVGAGNNAVVYSRDTSGPNPIWVRDSAKDFTLTASAANGGLAFKHSGTSQGFYATTITAANAITQYAPYDTDSSTHLHVTYANGDGTSSTAAAPVATTALQKRRFVYATLPPAPEGVDQAVVYAARGTSTPPALSSFTDRSETLTSGRSMLIDPTVSGGSEQPPTVSDFPSGAPGWLKSRVGGLYVMGDGSAGTSRTPTDDTDFATKEYVDTHSSSEDDPIAFPFASGYLNHTFGSNVYYRKVTDSIVKIGGIVTKTSGNFGSGFETIGTLPAGYRTDTGNSNNQQFFMLGGTNYNVFGRARIKDNGDIDIQASAAASYMSLDGIYLDLKATR